MVLAGLLYINETDVYDAYGAFLTEDQEGDYTNYNELQKASAMKPYTSVSFREEHGEKLPDTLTPRREARDVTLYFAIEATSAASFLARYYAFIAFLQSGWLTIRVPELNRSYKMYYKTSGAYSQLTPFEDGYLAAKFKVVLHEPVPAV